MTGGSRHKVVISTIVVFHVEPSAYAIGVWVEACPSDIKALRDVDDDIDLSGFVSPPPDGVGPFPVIADV